jgi:excisionase family DNA binding protein
MADELLLTVDEASRRISMCRSVVYRFIRRGELPSMKIGGSRRVLARELKEFIERLRERRDDTPA